MSVLAGTVLYKDFHLSQVRTGKKLKISSQFYDSVSVLAGTVLYKDFT